MSGMYDPTKVPYGCHCYKTEGITDDDIKTELCPYFSYIEEGLTQCNFLKVRSDEDELLEDQCKICGYNEERCDYEAGSLIVKEKE